MAHDFGWLKDFPLEKGVAALSEGRCPRCAGRLTQQVPAGIDIEDLTPDAPAFAQGGCHMAGHWLRAGHGGSDPDRDWFAVMMLNAKLEGVMTLSLNPPGHGDDFDDEEEW